MRPRLVQVKALKFGTVAGAFGIAHVDPDNEEAKEPFVDERAVDKLVANGFAKVVKTKIVDEDDEEAAEDKQGDAAAERTERRVAQARKGASGRRAPAKKGRSGSKAKAAPGTKAARPEDAATGSETRDSLALPKDVLATDSARGDLPAAEGAGGAAEDSPPAE